LHPLSSDSCRFKKQEKFQPVGFPVQIAELLYSTRNGPSQKKEFVIRMREEFSTFVQKEMIKT